MKKLQYFHMVLEENLLFYNEDDADTFIEYLLGKNCRVQKMTEGSIFEETLMKGRIGDMIHVIDLRRDGEAPGRVRDVTEIEKRNAVPDSPATHEECDMQEFLDTKMQENLESVRERIREMTEHLNPGDIIVTNAVIDGLKQRVMDWIEDDSEEGKVELLSQELLVQDCLRTMVDNGMAEPGTEGMILVKKTDPDDLIVERRAWDPDEVDPEILKSHNLSLDHHIDFGTTTRVVISPRIHFNCEPIEIEQALAGLEVDEDRAEILVGNMYRKKFIIDTVLNKIETAGRISLSDLIGEMKSVASTIDQEDCRLFLDSSGEFITGLVNDLRKAGFIEGNDRKIRVAR